MVTHLADEWARRIEAALPVSTHRMGNGSWIAVWLAGDAHDEGYGHRHPDACFSVEELDSGPDWMGLVKGRLGL